MNPAYCIIDPNLRDFLGHHASYDHAVARAAARAGYAPVVLGHVAMPGAEAGLVDGARLVPAFAEDIWAGRQGGSRLARLADTLRRNQVFRQALARHLPPALPAGSIVFAHMITERQILGLAGWAAGMPRGVRLVVLLRYQPSFYHGAIARRALRRFEGLAARGADIRLATDSDRLSARIGRLTRLAVATLPIPHAPAEIPLPDPAPDRPLTFVSLGNARGEKGFAEILTVARRIAAIPGAAQGIRFVLQANDPSEDVASVLRGFRSRPPPGVTLLDKALDHAAYEALLASADVVLAPYRREIYEDRTSGVALEAIATGRPLICTRATWLSDLLDRHGAGRAIPDGDVEALQDAIMAVRAEWTTLAASAARGATACRAVHNADALVRLTAGPWPAATATMPVRNVALFYPWGDFADPRSGASLRSNMLANLLSEAVEEVTVVQGGDPTPWLRRGNIHIQSSGDRIRHRLVRRALGLLTMPLLWPRARGQHLMLAMHLARLLDPDFHAHAARVIGRADHVFLEYTFWAPVIARLCRRHGVGLTVTDHDVVANQVTGSRLLREMTLRMEVAGLARGNQAACVSEADHAVFAARGVAAEVIPNPVRLALADCRLPAPPRRILAEYYGITLPQGPICLFIGSNFPPNVTAAEALRGIAREMAASEESREVTILVVGRCMEQQTAPGFQALGVVPDLALRCLYRIASLAVIPLRNGTGSSLKTLEAMAERLPVLGTRVAFRGLEVTPGQEAFIEDELEAWPHLIPGILEARGRAEAVARAGRAFAERFDHRSSFAPYLAALGLPPGGPGLAREMALLAAQAEAQLLERAMETRDLELMRECSERILRGAQERAGMALARG